MVNFGEKILEAHYLPWALHYIDYDHLKQVLDESFTQEDGGSQSSRQSASKSEFLSLLYIQTERVSFFVLQELGRITLDLAGCRQELLKGVDISETTELIFLEEKYVEAGEKILRLIRFVDLNVTGFRKILKKHDKLARTKLSLSYLALIGNSGMAPSSGGLRFRRLIGEELNLVAMGNQLMQPLLQDDTITAVVVAFEAGIEEVRKFWLRYEAKNAPLKTFSKLDKNSRSNTLPNLQLMEMENASVGVNRSHCDLQSFDSHDLMSKRGTASPGQILLQIHAARGRLHHTNEFIKLLAAHMLPISEDEVSLTKEGDRYRPSKLSNLLNLLSTFFYMTNYYIVAPTSGSYADKVGSDSSVASIIIGCTAAAALVSTILYSFWTSYSYKSALIFASTCSAVGNLLYASGLPFQSLTLVMLGRLMNGFGSARSINRRYIADSYSYSERTAASALFVTASALGMATGPALASILQIATAESTSVYWQAENAPGWFMFFVWVIFLVCLIWKFEDPPRHQPKISDGEAAQTQNGTKDEKKSLIGSNTTTDDEEDDDSVPLYCNIPVIITLIVYMVLKMILEAVLSSEANLTKLYFGWEGNIMGLHLTLLALLILPVNFGVAFLARSYYDRELIIGLLVAMLGGCIIIYQYQDSVEDYTLPQYLIGSAILFVCASALEAPNMSLLSKVIPRKWSKGIINVGLLATESGTFGRVVGDALLATMAGHGLDTMLNDSFGMFGAIVLAVIVVCIGFYRHLEPSDKDD